MRRLRLSCAIFFCWLFVLYNIERLYNPINIASFVYVFACLSAAPLVLVPRLSQVALFKLLAPLAAVMLVLKPVFGYSIGGQNLPLTLIELGVVSLTVAMAYHVGRRMEEARNAVVSTLISHLNQTRPFDKGLEDMYREVRRARAFNRPLALLAVAPTTDSASVTLDRFTKEAHKEAVEQYVQARLAKVLSTGTKGSDIITRAGDHFVMLLPETGRHKANRLVKKLRSKVQSELGLDIAIGASVFPDDEVTFVKLMERAQAAMDRSPGADLRARTEGVAIMHVETTRVPAAVTAPPNGNRNGSGNANGNGNGNGDGKPMSELVPATHYRRAPQS
ncbi:MAG: GGDEF domain-containing protein [Vicinamibacterales bacterium]